MSKHQSLLFQVGERAELRSFMAGFRGAWFRCELKDVARIKGQLKYQVQYYDYDDGLEWVKLYEWPKSKKGFKSFRRQLMLRPEFPLVYHERELSNMDVISDVSVVVDGSWSVGDLVDWVKDGCFWSGTITKVFNDDTVEVKLPRKPVGEGLIYTVSCKDLRPSLNWSPDSGWSFPTLMGSQYGHPHARLIQPVKQVSLPKSLVDVVVEYNDTDKATSRSSLEHNESIASHNSANSLPLLSKLMHSKNSLKLSKDNGESIELDSVSSSYIGDTSLEAPLASSGEQKVVEISAKKKRLFEAIPLNSTSCDNIESAIIDLEELVCRVKWLKQILKPDSHSTSVEKKWEFVSTPAVSNPKQPSG